jgi:flagellar biosynthesis protein FlhF
MLVRTYAGASEREVLALAKEDIGSDFIILNMRRDPRSCNSRDKAGSVRVTVGIDANQDSSHQPPKPLNRPDVHPQPKLLPDPRRMTGKNEPAAAELFLLRKQLRSMKARLRTRKDVPFREPFQACFGLLVESGVPDHVAEALVQRTEEQLRLRGALTRTALVEELRRQIWYLFLSLPWESSDHRQEVVALIGPSGAGKTSLLAKLASHPAVYGRRRVGIISTDVYRAGANAGLKSMATLLSAPIIEVRQKEDISRALRNLADYEVILVDTPGRSPLSRNGLNELQIQLTLLRPTETLAVLSANMGIEELWHFKGLYQSLQPTGLVVTKLDETNKPGKLLGLVDDPELPIRYVSIGQKVPHSLVVDVARVVIGRLPFLTLRG